MDGYPEGYLDLPVLRVGDAVRWYTECACYSGIVLDAWTKEGLDGDSYPMLRVLWADLSITVIDRELAVGLDNKGE